MGSEGRRGQGGDAMADYDCFLPLYPYAAQYCVGFPLDRWAWPLVFGGCHPLRLPLLPIGKWHGTAGWWLLRAAQWTAQVVVPLAGLGTFSATLDVSTLYFFFFLFCRREIWPFRWVFIHHSARRFFQFPSSCLPHRNASPPISCSPHPQQPPFKRKKKKTRTKPQRKSSPPRYYINRSTQIGSLIS